MGDRTHLNIAGMWVVALVAGFLDETRRVSTHKQTLTESCYLKLRTFRLAGF
jgi:hypothetical protein